MKPEREPYLRIIVGILVVAAIPPLGVIFFDGSESLMILERWQSGVGAFLGAFFGLGAILIGALFNADLNRRRDDRRQEQEARALAAALHAEMLAAIMIVQHLLAAVKNQFSEKKGGIPSDYQSAESLWGLDLPVYRANLQRLGILGTKLDRLAVADALSVEKTIRIVLYNLITAHDETNDGQMEIRLLENEIRDLRCTAEALRLRAGLPPDENTEAVEQLDTPAS